MNTNRWVESWTYNPYFIPSACLYEGYNEAPRIVRAIIDEMMNTKKIIGSASAALAMAQDIFTIPVTMEDVQMAYDIAAGGGCEFEWPME
jgi:hypothetical protein